MKEPQIVFLDIIEKVSSVLTFLFTSPPGILILIASVVLIVLMWISYTVHRASLLSKIVGKPFNAGSAFLAVMEALGKIAGKIIFWLPALAMITLITVSVITLGSTISRVEESMKAAQKIKDLSTLVKNLDRNYKVADVHILSVENGATKMRLEFYDPSNPGNPLEKKELVVPGRDIYFDSMVLNFDYSQISEGRKINIAIPYRIFSEKIPQREGIPLGAQDIMGTPYIFNRSDTDIYGLAPDVYRQRLAEFMELIRDEEISRREGIIRSVYGSAVHKRVNPGDHLEIRTEQTGGVVLRDVKPF